MSKEQNGKGKAPRAKRLPFAPGPWLLAKANGTLLLALPFALCIAGSWAWFNTDLGRPRSSLSALSSSPAIWLTARTNIPGYIFIEEPVSASVMKTLGTTNILSGSFYKIDISSQQSAVSSQTAEVSDQDSGLISDVRPLTSDVRSLTSETDLRPLTPGLTSDVRPLTSELSLDSGRSTLDGDDSLPSPASSLRSPEMLSTLDSGQRNDL